MNRFQRAACLLSFPVLLSATAMAADPAIFLRSLVGDWQGHCKTWFEPGVLADESPVTGSIVSVAAGPYVRHSYSATIQGRPRSGEELLIYNGAKAAFQASWFDDFHMNYGILFSEGPALARGFSVSGTYDVGPGEPAWGWRTEYELRDDGKLVITAFNITPQGEEAKAIETIYTRVENGHAAQERGDVSMDQAGGQSHNQSHADRALPDGGGPDDPEATTGGLKIALTSLLVTDQAAALRFYTEILGFTKKLDIPLGEYRWLTVTAPAGVAGVELLLEPDAYPAASTYRRALQADGLPAATFFVDDIASEHARLTELGVEFRSEPRQQGDVTVAVFDDTCGNLIQITEL